jgi:glutathione S-transferase
MEFVDLETAKAARGVRIETSTVVPSPWSEAAKATFTIAKVPFVAVRAMPRDAAIYAWTKSHNVPVVFSDDEPPRTVWSQIVALADRLAGPGRVLPAALDARVSTIGMLHEIAGEGGLGWNGRLFMIHASLTSNGERGFALPAAQYLAAKYGYAPDRIDQARSHAREVLAMLAARLGDAHYFGGDHPDALVAYSATFLTPLTHLTEQDCPNLRPELRAAFATAADALAADVPPSLLAHRKRMFDEHLPWPIEI